ncbi:MAG TPA: trigger factor [Gemmatimonadaceae bacterium]|nr:trigger factor [Gemmatimonadaceae bacterium]
MPMQFNDKQSTGVERRIQVSVPPDAVRDAEDKAARRYATKVRLPGFRPGKAPAAMVRKKFATEIRQEALEAIVRDAYQEVVTKQELKLAAQPHIHDLSFEEGKPMTFELHLELRPSLELARTSGFRVTRPVNTVSDEQVEEQLNQLRDDKAAWAPVEGKAQPGDMVRVAVATADESGNIPEPKEYPLVLGGGQAIPGIEDLIMTLEPGGTAEQPVRWPDDFPDEAQRGRTKTVRVILQDAKRKAPSPLDDAFAREVGDFESLDALRAAVRADLGQHASRDADAAVRQQLIDQIISANPFEIPPSWVNQMISGYMEAYGIPEADRERFATELRPMGERQVRRDLIIETLSEREGLAATEADLDDRIAKIAESRAASPGQIYASLEKAGRLKDMERGITEDKVFEWLLQRNEISDAKA